MSVNIYDSTTDTLHKVAGLVDDTDLKQDIEDIQAVIPSNANAGNQLVAQNATARLLNATYQGAGMSQRVVKLTLPSSVCGKFHVVCETGGQTSLRDFIIQTTTRTPYVNVYNLGLRMDYIVKKDNGNEIYINVPTSDGSVLIYQEDANADGYGNLYTVTLTTTTVTDEAFINATTVTPVNIRPTSTVTSGSTAPITSGGVASYAVRKTQISIASGGSAAYVFDSAYCNGFLSGTMTNVGQVYAQYSLSNKTFKMYNRAGTEISSPQMGLTWSYNSSTYTLTLSGGDGGVLNLVQF